MKRDERVTFHVLRFTHRWGVSSHPSENLPDGFFTAEVLDKHVVPFMVDLDAWLETLARLPTLDYAHFCPGHGQAHNRTALAKAAAYNAERLRDIRQRALKATAPTATGEQVLQRVATGLGLVMDNPTQYYLNHTAVLAALASLYQKV